MTASEERDDLAAMLREAKSPSWSIRAAAGCRLAADAEDKEVARVLNDLLLDGQDTAVTQQTTEALLRRNDVPGLRLVLAALAEASDTAVPDWDPSTMDEIYAAIWGDPRWMGDSSWAPVGAQLRELSLDADESVREMAMSLLSRVEPPSGS